MTNENPDGIGTFGVGASPIGGHDDPKKTGRNPDGTFAPGNRVNPAGKPVGARHKAVQALDALGRDTGAELVRSVIKAALAGDMSAMRIVLDRIWPARRGAPVAIDLPAIRTADDVVAAMAAIADAASDGDLSPEEAETFAKLIEANRKALETADLERRLAALEAKEAVR